MTDSLQRIYDRFAADAVAACAEGRGKALMDGFIQDLAANRAEVVFLRMDTALAQATEETIADVWAWLQQYPYENGLNFIEGISTALRVNGASDEQRADAERLAAKAYQEHLDRLLEQPEIGGTA